MYQVVEREAVFTSSGRLQENNVNTANYRATASTANDNKSTLRLDGGIGGIPGKWKNVDDDNFSSGAFQQ